VNFSELQRAVQHHVLHADTAVLPEINESPKVSRAIRLSIYSNAYRLRLIEALGENFRQLLALLGDEAFNAIALEYIAAHPPQHYSIRWYGAELGRYLLETRSIQPWFGELAQWDWGLVSAFDAANATPVEVDALAAIEPDQWWTLRFDLHPSFRHLRLRTNAQAIYKALIDKTEPPEPMVLEVEQDWLIWRQELTTRFRSMLVGEARALELVSAGATFEELCEALCEWYDTEAVPTQAATLLKSWVTEGLIIAVRTTATDSGDDASE
jgi:Putative DNA-binding domain